MKVKCMPVHAKAVNAKVKVAKSRLPFEGAGKGLFAAVAIEKNELICTYGGKLIDAQEAKYCSPVYIVNFENGKGFKLDGDDTNGDLGIYANAVHPEHEFPKQNARFHTRSKKFLPNGRGVFNIVAKQNTAPGEEIIVDYSNGYWLTMHNWNSQPRPVKSAAVLARDKRVEARSAAK